MKRKRLAVYQIKVEFAGIAPPIWRRLRVPAAIHLGKLHYLLLDLFDWEGDADYDFAVNGVRVDDPRNVDLRTLATPQSDVTYTYGPWRLAIRAEAELFVEALFVAPLCYEGERAAPPEDCGGPSGYAATLVRSEHADFDPEHCDLDAANRRIQSSDRA